MIKQMQWLFHVLLCVNCVILLVVLCGCTNQSDPVESSLPEANTEVIEESQDMESLSDGTDAEDDSVKSESKNVAPMTLNQIMKDTQHSLFIQRGEEFYPLSTDVYKGGGSSYSREPSFLTQDEEHQGNGTPVINIANGDRIVTTRVWDGNKLKFYPVVKESYTGIPPNNWGFVAEINGLNVENSSYDQIKDCLNGFGIRLTDSDGTGDLESDLPTSLIIGRYEGTKFVEETINVKTPSLMVYFGGENYHTDLPVPTVLPTEKTKEGFFYVDSSGLAPGKYAMYNEGAKMSQTYKISVFEVQ